MKAEKILLLTFIVLITFFNRIMAQHRESLTVYPRFGGAHFEYTNDTATFDVSPKEVLEIVHDDPLAYAEFKKARSNNRAAGILGFAGGSLLAIPLVEALMGNSPEWSLAAGGAALLVTSIPFHKAFRKHAENSVDLFNKKHTAFKPRAEYFLSGLGARIVIRF